MSCDSQPSLFEDLEERPKPQGRRNPTRHTASRQKEVNLHLPIYAPEEAELRRLEDLAVTQRPIARGDCEQEARPCPWVRCPKHLYFDRFVEFEAIMDAIAEAELDLPVIELLESERYESIVEELSDCPERWPEWARGSHRARTNDDEAVQSAIVEALVRRFTPTDDPDGKAKRPRTREALREAVSRGRAMFTSLKKGKLRSDVLSSPHVRGPWPTCSLDVADNIREAGAELEQEDTARVNGLTREGVRQIEIRVLPRFAAERGLRPWLEELVGEERLEELSKTSVDWFGDD